MFLRQPALFLYRADITRSNRLIKPLCSAECCLRPSTNGGEALELSLDIVQFPKPPRLTTVQSDEKV